MVYLYSRGDKSVKYDGEEGIEAHVRPDLAGEVQLVLQGDGADAERSRKSQTLHMEPKN